MLMLLTGEIIRDFLHGNVRKHRGGFSTGKQGSFHTKWRLGLGQLGLDLTPHPATVANKVWGWDSLTLTYFFSCHPDWLHLFVLGKVAKALEFLCENWCFQHTQAFPKTVWWFTWSSMLRWILERQWFSRCFTSVGDVAPQILYPRLERRRYL